MYLCRSVCLSSLLPTLKFETLYHHLKGWCKSAIPETSIPNSIVLLYKNETKMSWQDFSFRFSCLVSGIDQHCPRKTEVKSVPKNLRSCSWRLCFLIAIDCHDWVFLLFLEMWQKHRKQIFLECFAWILGGFLCTYVYALSGVDEVSW